MGTGTVTPRTKKITPGKLPPAIYFLTNLSLGVYVMMGFTCSNNIFSI